MSRQRAGLKFDYQPAKKATPTTAPPGTAEKIEELIRRASKREELFSEFDSLEIVKPNRRKRGEPKTFVVHCAMEPILTEIESE